MDEALKAKLAYEQRQPNRKRQHMAAESKWAKVKKWFVLHPKVQAAFYGLVLVILLNAQDVYNNAIDYREAFHRVIGAILVAALAYAKKSNGSTV